MKRRFCWAVANCLRMFSQSVVSLCVCVCNMILGYFSSVSFASPYIIYLYIIWNLTTFNWFYDLFARVFFFFSFFFFFFVSLSYRYVFLFVFWNIFLFRRCLFDVFLTLRFTRFCSCCCCCSRCWYRCCCFCCWRRWQWQWQWQQRWWRWIVAVVIDL